MESIIATPIFLTDKTVIEVFKTNVNDYDEAISLRMKLLDAFPACKINFDLQDCDKILRIEGISINLAMVIDILTTGGYICEVLI